MQKIRSKGSDSELSTIQADLKFGFKELLNATPISERESELASAFFVSFAQSHAIKPLHLLDFSADQLNFVFFRYFRKKNVYFSLAIQTIEAA